MTADRRYPAHDLQPILYNTQNPMAPYRNGQRNIKLRRLSVAEVLFLLSRSPNAVTRVLPYEITCCQICNDGLVSDAPLPSQVCRHCFLFHRSWWGVWSLHVREVLREPLVHLGYADVSHSYACVL